MSDDEIRKYGKAGADMIVKKLRDAWSDDDED
jgi:hypothetical protein